MKEIELLQCILPIVSISFSLLFFAKKGNPNLKDAEKYGGSDWKDWKEYTKKDNVPYFDKGGHKKRSIANDPKHLDHWKKVDNQW